MAKLSPGAFVFPVCVVAYTAYSLTQQISDGARSSLLTYALCLGIPIFILAAIVIFREVMAARQVVAGAAPVPEVPLNRVRPVLLVGLGVVTFLAFEPLGYLIAFAIFMVGSMLLFQVRSPIKIVALTACTLAFVHFLFAKWLELSLPAGILEGIL